MIWKKHPVYTNYELSEDGHIRNCRMSKYLLPVQDNRGYLSVTISGATKGRNKKLHILVAETFLGPVPQGKIVHHKDDNKLNPRVSNLEYVSSAENSQLSKRQTKLTKEDVM